MMHVIFNQLYQLHLILNCYVDL